MGDYKITVFLYHGFRAQSVWIVFFCASTGLNRNMDAIRIWGSCIEDHKILPTRVMGALRKPIYIFVWFIVASTKYLSPFFLYYKKTCLASGKFKSNKIESLSILFQRVSCKERRSTHFRSNRRWVRRVIYLPRRSFMEHKVRLM